MRNDNQSAKREKKTEGTGDIWKAIDKWAGMTREQRDAAADRAASGDAKASKEKVKR